MQSTILLYESVRLSVRLSVTLWYYIEMNSHIVIKLFPPSAKSMIRFFERYRRYKIPRGTRSAGALNTRRWEICDFRQRSPFISERIRDMPIVTRNLKLAIKPFMNAELCPEGVFVKRYLKPKPQK